MFDGRYSTDLKRKITYFLGLLSIVVLVAACGTHRKNPIAKLHHSTNTLFNYYYNAERLWGETVKEVNGTFRVPPEGFIPVMYVGDEEAAKTFGSQFDEVIKKCDIAGEKHKSPKWKDDLRFLVGRSHFYKQNYFLAIQNFRYVADSFPESPHVVDAYLWMVKSYHMNGNEILAQQVLDEKLKGKKLNNRQRGELAIIKADVALSQDNHDEVIKTLNAEFKYIKGKLNRARAHYLLGQIYASRGQIAKAEPHFKAVSKMNTDYELIFNAKLSIASLYVGDKGDALERVRVTKMLRRMLRDFKNGDYKDQIYYQLAMVEQGAGHLDPAIQYLKSSIAFNTSNQRQKALSYYKIGQIYFYDKKDFKMAEAYFDSAATAINKDAPEYKEVSTISKTLKEYVKHLHTIEYQDSMLALAKMDSTTLARHIAGIMAEEQRKEQARQQEMMEEIDRMNDPNLFNQVGSNPGDSRGRAGGFYFSDPVAVENGRVDFKKVWGQRKNEDHWNRKHKAASFAAEDDPAAAPVDSGLVKLYGDKAKYYRDIPKTEEDIAARHQMIMEAMFGLATVYNNKLNMPDSAVAVFTRLTRRYPESDYYLKSLYAIYKIYEKTDDIEADKYKSRICTKDPTSLYCKLCNNQDIQADLKALDADFQGAYNALYAQYQSKEYSTCIDFSNFIGQRFVGHEDMPKVYYLRGLAFGYLGNLDSLKTVFTYVKTNYPEHEVTPVVIKTLERMSGGKPSEPGATPVSSGGSSSGDDRFKDFKASRGPGEQVFVIITTGKDKTTSGDFQVKVNDFNNKNFASDKLTTSIFFYQKRLHMAYVSKFTSEQAALTYIGMISKSEGIESLLSGDDQTIAFITPANFRVAYGQQKLTEYLEYYKTVLLPSFQ
jgi:tetratricopeptide (TPR) repeat protein